MIVYKLDQNIDGSKLLKDIQDLINKFGPINSNNIPMLCISIKTVAYDDTTMIPKIEHKKSP